MVFSYFCSEIDNGANVNDDSAELAKFAKSLATEHRFVFKGMENTRNVSPPHPHYMRMLIHTLYQ